MQEHEQLRALVWTHEGQRTKDLVSRNFLNCSMTFAQASRGSVFTEFAFPLLCVVVCRRVCSERFSKSSNCTRLYKSEKKIVSFQFLSLILVNHCLFAACLVCVRVAAWWACRSVVYSCVRLWCHRFFSHRSNLQYRRRHCPNHPRARACSRSVAPSPGNSSCSSRSLHANMACLSYCQTTRLQLTLVQPVQALNSSHIFLWMRFVRRLTFGTFRPYQLSQRPTTTTTRHRSFVLSRLCFLPRKWKNTRAWPRSQATNASFHQPSLGFTSPRRLCALARVKKASFSLWMRWQTYWLTPN